MTTTPNYRLLLTRIAEEASADPDTLIGTTPYRKIIRVLGELALAGNETLELRTHALRMTLETIRHCAHAGLDGDAELDAAFNGDTTALTFFRVALGSVQTTREARAFLMAYTD